MSAYIRRFTFDPGDDVLLNIESVNILDLTPPAALAGVGTGTVLVVGEFEDGPYAYTLEADDTGSLKSQFGGVGYTYGNLQAQYPSAIARKADGAGAAEYWNGNSLIQLNGKQYSRLLCCRVNTSVGNVTFTRLPYVQGLLSALSYTLQPGQIVQVDLGAGPQSATFSAAAATVTSSAPNFAGLNPGDQVTLGADALANFTVTFLSGDGTQAGVIARINQYAGFAFATIAGGVTSVTQTAHGSGYTAIPTVVFSQPQAPAGVQAQGTAVMGVYTLVLDTGGNYGGTPTVSITGGGGSGATATLTMSGSAVATLTITGNGTGFTSPPTVSFVGGSPVVQATAHTTLGVLSTTVGTAGSGYTMVPTVTYVGGGGTGAIGTAVESTTNIALVSRVQGTSGQVRIVSSAPAGVLANLGISASTVQGTGNVANIANVQRGEAQSVIQGISNLRVEFLTTGQIRLSNTSPGTAPYLIVLPGTTATAFGLPTTLATGSLGTQQGQALVLSSAVTLPPNGADTVTLGIDALPNVTVTFAGSESTTALLIAAINAAFAAAGQPSVASADGSTYWYLQSALQNTTAAQVRVVAASSAGVLTKLGLVLGTTFGSGPPIGQLPAGTPVQVPGTSGPVFVTTQTVNFTASGVMLAALSKAAGGTQLTTAGPYTVPIRHALDDGSGIAASAGGITQMPISPTVGSFSVQNLAPTTNALTESAIDAQYVAALATTLNINSVAKQTNIVFSARQSNTVRSALRSNALSASANGCFGRVACVRPPLNTDGPMAVSSSAPGVGATSDERVFYCYIGSNAFVPVIGLMGVAGNPVNTNYQAFTADGNIDVGSDSLMASILSQLPPEENPGQDTPFAANINGTETGSNVQAFQMSDYINFKANGIAALRVDDGQVGFQSGVTSLNPVQYPSQTTIARRRMADYLQDSMAQRGKAYSKKLMTLARRRALAGEYRQFLVGLLSANNPQFQRIGGFTMDAISGNTNVSLGKGLNRYKISVRTLASMDAIVLETTIGQQVIVQEVLPQKAA